MHVRKRSEHSIKAVWRRTFAAQIHLVGAILMAAGGCYLIPAAHRLGSEFLWSAWVFILTGILVFTGSFLFHFLTDGFHVSTQLEIFLEKLDHFGIYLFIAGTYTAFLASVIDEPWKSRLLITIWTIAGCGIFYTFFQERLPQKLRGRMIYTGIFVVMGWTILLRSAEIWQKLKPEELGLLVGGAASYTIGAVIFYLKKPSLFRGYLGHHEIWHLLVLVGALFHYLLIFSFYSAEMRVVLSISASSVGR
jgi:hemolysin III